MAYDDKIPEEEQTKMGDNIELFKFSGENVSFFSEEFTHDELVISENPEESLTKLQIAAREIRECLAALSCLDDGKNTDSEQALEIAAMHILGKLQRALEVQGANFTEFASFWAVLDMSYSVYDKLPDSLKAKTLKTLVKSYLEKRHKLYSKYGFSDTTLQVRSDQVTHKKNGRAGIDQLRRVLLGRNYEELTGGIFSGPERCFLAVDSYKSAYKEFLRRSEISFEWSGGHQGKVPDLIMKNGSNFWIIEHKHMKEPGGGQDKQLSELVYFISGEEREDKNVNYIAVLDGALFHFLATAKQGKLSTTRKDICNALTQHRKNYFLNMAGFEKFLSTLP